MVKPSQPDALVARMESVADPTRLRLLRLLERHELGVAELCDVVQMPQSTVSRHLKVLTDNGWTRGRRQGTNHLYRLLLDELDPAARKLWLLMREQTEDWPAVQQDRLRLERTLRDRQNEAQAFFAGAAGEWDKLREQHYGNRFIDDALFALIPSDWTVADLGCGTGQLAARLAQQVKHVIGVDSSAAMLKAARKRTQDLQNVDLRRGDLETLPIDDACCDAALIVLVLSYLPDVVPALRESRRILKPGGKLIVVDLLAHDRDDFRRQMGQQHLGFSPQVLSQMMAEAELVGPRITPLAPEPSVKGPALLLASATNGCRTCEAV